MKKNKIYVSHVKVARCACLILVFCLGWSLPVKASDLGGRAFGAFVRIPLGAGPVYISDTGELSPDGGWSGGGLLSTSIPGVLRADVLVAATSGAAYLTTGDQANSSASLSNLVILPGQIAEVTASFVRAEAVVTESGGQGSTEIRGLTFGGVPIAVTGQPNQRVEIPGAATLIINEQTASSPGALTVNALRLILAGGGEVIVSSARSSLGS